jgi:hypothetical protein
MQVINTGTLAPIPFTSVDVADVQSRLSTALSLTARIIKADQTSVAGAGSFDQPDSVDAPGCRRYTPAATDSSVTGPAIARISATGMEPREVPFLVIGYSPNTSPGARTPGFLPIQNSETAAAHRSVPFTAVSSSDLQTRLNGSGLTFTVRIVKADGTSAAGGGSVVHPDDTNARGCCFYVGAAADFDVNGETIIRISAATMETREITVTVVGFDPYAEETAPNDATATTSEAIRDRIITVIKELAPISDTALSFEPFRNELAGNFRKWADGNATAAHRRFQVRDVGKDQPPDITNTDVEARLVTFEITIAYPQTHRWGGDNTLDRDDVMSQDQHQIEHNIGASARENFTPPTYPDAYWREGETTRVIGRACDFLVIRQTMGFFRSMT